MTRDELAGLLDRVIAGWENEVVEFKEGGAGFSTGDIGKYYSALANEANLRGAESGWLVFGVRDKDRAIVGTRYRPEAERLQALKNDIAGGTETRATFRDIHELVTETGRVLMFEVPPAPQGIPIAWNGHYYARNGESLGSLALGKLDEIRGQGARQDWSAAIVSGASVADLDPEALSAARKAFTMRRSGRIPADEIDAWPADVFLEKARLTIGGGVTRTALLLLGKPESSHLLSPLLAEITWALVGEERVYEHFGLPFLLSTSKAYARIRNYNIRMLQPGTLIQAEVEKYDRASVLEAIHNCVAHADYRSGARIVMQEYPDRIVLKNQGDFLDGTPEDYVLRNRIPMTYRNPFLVNAMVELNMIDRLGSGISTMTRSQARRFLPLPDYNLTEPGAVTLTIYGAVIDENFSQALMAHTDLTLDEILTLDRVQKGLEISADASRRLHRSGLIEGRRPHLHVSAEVAKATGRTGDYIRQRAQDDAHYARLIVDFLRQYGHATRQDVDQLLEKYLSERLNDTQRRDKVTNLLSKMRREQVITNAGTRQRPRWTLV